MSGVPSEVLVEDHMQVRAPLVALLKSANAALVWTRIDYRAKHASFAHERDGVLWWEVTARDLAIEVGLSADQVERALTKLIEGGYLLAEQHSLPMQTLSYATVIAQSAISPIGEDLRDIATSNPRYRDVQSAISPIAPLLRHQGVKDTVGEAFERCWSAWPSTRRGARKKAESSFRTALKVVGMGKLEKLVVTLEAHAEAWRSWSASEQQFVPMISTWLNQERWTTPVPVRDRGKVASKTSRAAAVMEMGRRLEPERQKQVSG